MEKLRNEIKTLGTGYTKAQIIVEMENNKFVGYIPTNGEYIIATNDNRGGYCWSKYFPDLKNLLNHLKEQKELADAVLDYIERTYFSDKKELFNELLDYMERKGA